MREARRKAKAEALAAGRPARVFGLTKEAILIRGVGGVELGKPASTSLKPPADSYLHPPGYDWHEFVPDDFEESKRVLLSMHHLATCGADDVVVRIDIAGWRFGEADSFGFTLAIAQQLQAKYGVFALTEDNTRTYIRDGRGRSIESFFGRVAPPWPEKPDAKPTYLRRLSYRVSEGERDALCQLKQPR